MFWPQVRGLLRDLRAPSDKRSGLVDTAFLAFASGVIWRVVFIFHSHPIRNFIYSDMQSYFNEALRFYNSRVILGPIDSLHPPGTSLLFGLALHHAHGWFWVSLLQLLLSVGVPILIFLIALLLYGRTVALISLTFASLYIAFVEFSGFLLSETPYTFFMLLSFLLLVIALKSKRPKPVFIWGLASGLVLGYAASFKTTILISGLCTALVLIGLAAHKMQKHVPLLLAAVIIGSVPVIAGLTARCTHLNQGQFCMISSNGQMNILMGHYGRVANFKFVDKRYGMYYNFADPATLQEGYSGSVTLPFGPYQESKSLSVAKSWSRAHPGQALELSVHHIYDLFSTVPWPSSNTEDRGRIILSERLYKLFVLPPVVVYAAAQAFQPVRKKIKDKRNDLLIIAPIIGLFITVFITASEPRYRIPYDGFFIILAARAYTFAWSLRKRV